MKRMNVGVTVAMAVAVAVTVAGCASATDDPGEDGAAGVSAFAVQLPAGDVAAVLALVNYPGTDVDTLDRLVGLDARAARGIVAARSGPDGISPSADDVPFATVAQVDAIPYVGDAALRKLDAYAQAHPAPAGETVKAVAFQGWQAEAVIWGVNQADLATLNALLDVRAAQGLVAHRPFASVAAMGGVGYVGAAALGALRGEAQTWWGALRGAGADCVAKFDDAVGPHLGDLLFLSESDRPFDLVSFSGAGGAAPTAASVAALVKAPADSRLYTRSVDNYFAAFEMSSSSADPMAAELVEAAVKAQLTDVVYIAIQPPAGSVDQALVDVYLLGRTSCGDLVGLHAVAVET